MEYQQQQGRGNDMNTPFNLQSPGILKANIPHTDEGFRIITFFYSNKRKVININIMGFKDASDNQTIRKTRQISSRFNHMIKNKGRQLNLAYFDETIG